MFFTAQEHLWVHMPQGVDRDRPTHCMPAAVALGACWPIMTWTDGTPTASPGSCVTPQGAQAMHVKAGQETCSSGMPHAASSDATGARKQQHARGKTAADVAHAV